MTKEKFNRTKPTINTQGVSDTTAAPAPVKAEIKPTVKPVDGVLEAHGAPNPVVLLEIKQIEEYCIRMAPGQDHSERYIGEQHSLLHESMMKIISNPNDNDFRIGMDHLMAMFRKYRDGALGLVMTQRSIGFWSTNEETRDTYSNLCTIFTKIAPVNPAARNQAKGYSFKSMLAHLPADKSSRLESYIKTILGM